jgi:hypothetical protein
VRPSGGDRMWPLLWLWGCEPQELARRADQYTPWWWSISGLRVATVATVAESGLHSATRLLRWVNLFPTGLATATEDVYVVRVAEALPCSQPDPSCYLGRRRDAGIISTRVHKQNTL